MTSNDITGPIPITVQNANPLLFTLPQEDTSIRPYWMVIGQNFVAQQVHRVFYRLFEGSWLTPMELGVIIIIITIIKRVKIPPPPPSPTTPPPSPLSSHHYRPRIIAYFIPTYIQKWLSAKNVNDNSILPYHKQQVDVLLDKMRKKYRDKLRFSIADCEEVIPLLVHSIYYCVIQASCMSAEKATTWNCYNIFGYRLYQNVFSSYFEFACTFLFKCVYGTKITPKILREQFSMDETKSRKKKSTSLRYYFRLFSYYSGLCSSIVTFIFVTCLLLPFLITNIIPMVAAYAFIHIIYWGAMSIILSFGGFFMHLPYVASRWIVVAAIFLDGIVLYTFPILILITYNYSQFFLYGDDYFQTMTDEFDGRNFTKYEELFKKSDKFRFHTIINFF